MTTTDLTIRSALLSDLARLTEIHNHYVTNTHITFDVRPFQPEERLAWFHEHSDGQRYRLLVAEQAGLGVVGYATTGRFRSKAAYDTTVEVSVACDPNATGRGIGTALYRALFTLIAGQDIHRMLAGIAQPNIASNALHEKFGFKPIGTFTSVGRKFGKYWDVVWMERPLAISPKEANSMNELRIRENLLDKLEILVSKGNDRRQALQEVADAVKVFGNYRWVGLYEVDYPAGLVRNLVWSGPGAPEYPTFAVNRGLTGAAIASRRTINVGDVASDSRYLTAFSSTRSEIIIPVFDQTGASVVGTIDVESERRGAFSEDIQELLENCSKRIQPLWSG